MLWRCCEADAKWNSSCTSGGNLDVEVNEKILLTGWRFSVQKPLENGRKGWDFMRNGVLVVSLVCFVCSMMSVHRVHLLKMRPLDDLSRPHPAEWVSRSFCITCAKMDKNALFTVHHQWLLVSKANVGAHWSDVLRPWSLLTFRNSERLKGCQDSKCEQQNAPKLRYCSFGSLRSSLQNITSRASPVRHPPHLYTGHVCHICHTLVRVITWRLAFRVHFYNSYSAKRKMCRMCLMELWKFRFFCSSWHFLNWLRTPVGFPSYCRHITRRCQHVAVMFPTMGHATCDLPGTGCPERLSRKVKSTLVFIRQRSPAQLWLTLTLWICLWWCMFSVWSILKRKWSFWSAGHLWEHGS